MDTKMGYEKKVTLANFSDARRNVGRTALREKQKEFVDDDGFTSSDKRYKKIEDAANGCWWVKQYIMGSIAPNKKNQGIDDE